MKLFKNIFDKKNNSRTKNVSINVVVGVVCQIVNLIANFVARTIFISILGKEYLGANGLFANILTILSFAELGIGNAIIFNLYKAIADNDEEKIKSLVRLYKKAYLLIAGIVLAVGLLIIPFFPIIIKETPNISENIIVLYLLFLLNSVFSYPLAYSKAIFTANQKNYINLIVNEATHVLQVVFQCTFLFLTHNYLGYLFIQLGFTVLDNVVLYFLSRKKYPYLKDGAVPLSKSESRGIFINVWALAFYKLGSVILNGTDNILISSMIGLVEVGLLSNYLLLINACSALLGRVSEGFIASIGNLNTNSTQEKKYAIFNEFLFISIWIFGFAFVGLFSVINPFISTWIGDDYLLGLFIVFVVLVEFFIKGVHSPLYIFRTTMGYFRQGRWSAIIAAICNLVLSIVLGRWLGLIGILIATPISRMFIISTVDAYLVYKNVFSKNHMIYWAKCMGYFALVALIGSCCFILLNALSFTGWIGVLLDIFIVTLIYNGFMLLVFFRTRVFRSVLARVRSLIGKKGGA